MRKNHNRILVAYIIIMVMYIMAKIYLGVQKRQEVKELQPVVTEQFTEFTIGRFVVYDTPQGYQAVTNGVSSGYHSRAILSINELIVK